MLLLFSWRRTFKIKPVFGSYSAILRGYNVRVTQKQWSVYCYHFVIWWRDNADAYRYKKMHFVEILQIGARKSEELLVDETWVNILYHNCEIILYKVSW